MTANEAKRAREAYMAGEAGDMVSQINAINALFVMVEELQNAVKDLQAENALLVKALEHAGSELGKIEYLRRDLDALKEFVEVRADSLSALYPRVAHLESETFGMVMP